MSFEPETLPDAAPSSDPRLAVPAMIARWAEAWNAHDADAMAELVACDVDFVNVSGRWLQGADEFREWHRHIHRLHLRDSRWSNLQYRSKFLTAELALVHLEWSIEGERTAAGTPGPQRSGVFTWLLQRRDEAWLIAAAHNTNLGPGVSHRLSAHHESGCSTGGAGP